VVATILIPEQADQDARRLSSVVGQEVPKSRFFVFCNARKNRLKILYRDGYATLVIMGRHYAGLVRCNKKHEARSHIKELGRKAMMLDNRACWRSAPISFACRIAAFRIGWVIRL